jgi:tRNA (guanine37-N1)-methyltransferase
MTSLRIDVFSLFPQLVEDFCAGSILGRAQQSQYLDLRTHDLREGSEDRRRSVDDTPFGGGPGMVISPEPVFNVVEQADPPRPLFLLSPGGRRFDQRVAEELAETGGFSLLCGRYEGVDERVREHLCDGELSIGDFVLSGGEVAAVAIIEAVTRLVPGVMGNIESAGSESFGNEGLLEYPQYTRPADFRGWEVPPVLLSGNHAAIEQWRKERAVEKTQRVRPDLLGTQEADSDL